MMTTEEILEWIDGQIETGNAFIKTSGEDTELFMYVAATIGRVTTLQQLRAEIKGEEFDYDAN